MTLKRKGTIPTAIARGMDDAEVYSLRASANVRLERLESARRDCEQAEGRAPGDELTHGCWGDLHLALREYDHAIARYESALEAASGTNWHFELALVLLLASRFDDAKTAYSTALAEASAFHIREALSALKFWTESEADNITSAEAKETVVAIRRDLQSGLESTLHP